jgi:DNA polymerase III subunit delta'
MKPWLKTYQQHFSALIAQERLPHALLIHGMDGSGKQTLTDWLVQTLLCQQPKLTENNTVEMPCGRCKSCLLFLSNTYPDHKVIVSDKATIGVDDIRATNTFLEKTAFFGSEAISLENNSLTQGQGKKTVVITEAEKMTVAAANALLKTLEEPSNNSVIILLSRDVESLLPTIISRCRLISIRPPVGEQLAAEQGLLSADAFANISQLPELSDKAVMLQHDDFLQKLLHYLHNQQGFEDVVVLLVDNRHAYRWFEKIMVNLMRAQYNCETAKLTSLNEDLIWAEQLDKQVVWQIYQLIVAANKQLKSLSQANRQFIVEKLLLESAVLLSNEKIRFVKSSR